MAAHQFLGESTQLRSRTPQHLHRLRQRPKVLVQSQVVAGVSEWPPHGFSFAADADLSDAIVRWTMLPFETVIPPEHCTGNEYPLYWGQTAQRQCFNLRYHALKKGDLAALPMDLPGLVCPRFYNLEIPPEFAHREAFQSLYDLSCPTLPTLPFLRMLSWTCTLSKSLHVLRLSGFLQLQALRLDPVASCTRLVLPPQLRILHIHGTGRSPVFVEGCVDKLYELSLRDVLWAMPVVLAQCKIVSLENCGAIETIRAPRCSDLKIVTCAKLRCIEEPTTHLSALSVKGCDLLCHLPQGSPAGYARLFVDSRVIQSFPRPKTHEFMWEIVPHCYRYLSLLPNRESASIRSSSSSASSSSASSSSQEIGPPTIKAILNNVVTNWFLSETCNLKGVATWTQLVDGTRPRLRFFTLARKLLAETAWHTFATRIQRAYRRHMFLHHQHESVMQSTTLVADVSLHLVSAYLCGPSSAVMRDDDPEDRDDCEDRVERDGDRHFPSGTEDDDGRECDDDDPLLPRRKKTRL